MYTIKQIRLLYHHIIIVTIVTSDAYKIIVIYLLRTIDWYTMYSILCMNIKYLTFFFIGLNVINNLFIF